MSIGGGGGGGDPGPTEQERASAERGANEWNDFSARAVPLSDKYISIVDDPNRATRLEGNASADVAAATSGGARAGLDAILSSGSKGGGAAASAVSLAPLQRASATGKAMNSAKRTADDLQLTGLAKMSAFGRGVSFQSSDNLAQANANATQEAIADAAAKTQKYVSTLDAIGRAAGMAGGAAVSSYSRGQTLGRYARANPEMQTPDFGGGLSGWITRSGYNSGRGG